MNSIRKSGTRVKLAMGLALGLAIGLAALPGCEVDSKNGKAATQAAAPSLVDDALGTTSNVHRHGTVYMSGQPAEQDIALLKTRGIKTVINLRTSAEMKFDERQMVKDAGMEYHQIPVGTDAPLTASQIDAVRKLLADPANHPVLLHCASANRVGAIWMAHRAIDGGLTDEQAKLEALKVGMKPDTPFARYAQDYIKSGRK